MLEDTEVHEYGEGTYPQARRTDWRRTSWGAIFAGAFVTLAIFLTLQILGAGIGASTIDLTGRETTSPRALGIGAAVWWLITGLISLFIGGWVAGRLGWLPNKLDRTLHGLTVWALFYVAMLYLVTTTLSAVVGGGLSLLGQTASAAGQVAAGAAQGQGLTSEMIQEELGGTAQQGQQAGSDVVSAITNYFRGPQTAQDRQQLAQAIAQSTGVSEAQANQTIQNLEQRAQQAKETGEEVANVTGVTFIGLSVAMLLGAVAAILGSLLAPAPKSLVPPYERGRTRTVETHADTYASR